MDPPVTERRLALGAIGVSLAVFAVLLIRAGGFYPSFDEQKYLGVGYNIWAGRGMTTVFGPTFDSHAPLWSAVLTAPTAWFGADALAWGRALDGLSGLGIVAAAAAFAWRYRPAAGAVAAVAMVALLYLHDQTRTARLDVPAAALALLFVLVGLGAVRRGSSRWAITAGVVFAIGFVVKEIDLPYAPVPILAGIVWGRPWRVLFRLGAWMLAMAAIGTGWWFVLYASLEHDVYRLGTPAWTLIPIGIGVVVAIGLGLAAERLAERPAVRRTEAAMRKRLPDVALVHGRAIVGWLATLAWALVLLVVFLKTSRLSGTSGLAPSQLVLYARAWFTTLRVLILFCAIGGGLALVAAVAARRTELWRPIADLVIASICGAPLILLVIAVGEPPRNYLAQIAIGAALAAIGSVWAIDRLLHVRRPRVTVPVGALLGVAAAIVLLELVLGSASLVSRTSIAVGLTGLLVGAFVGAVPELVRRRPGIRAASLRTATAVVLGAAGLIAASGALASHALTAPPNSTGPARDAAVSTVSAWLRANVPPGQTVAFGSFLGYDMALGLQGRNRTVQVRHRLSVASISAPEAMLRTGEPPADDWIAIDIAPRNVSQFQAYRAAWLTQQLPAQNVAFWVYAIGISTSAPSIVPALTPDHGFDQLAHWTFPVGGTAPPLETYVFAVHTDRLSFDTSKLYIAPNALARLATLFASNPTVAAPTARHLLDRIVVVPDDPTVAGSLARLRAIAGP